MPGDMMPISEIRRRTQLMYPPVQQFVERFAGVVADDVFVYDVVSGELAVPVELARTAIENYEAERAEGVRAQAEYDRYRKDQAEKARLERNRAAEKEQKAQAEKAEKNAAALRKAKADLARKNAPAESPKRKLEADAAGNPLSFTDWLKKGRPAK